MPFIVTEAGTPAIERFLRSNRSLAVSDFAAAETSSAISKLVRMGQLDWADGASALSALDAWRAAVALNIGVTGLDIRLADAFVRRFDLKLRAPGALHMAVCRRLADTLVTFDVRLAQAARVLGIETVQPA